MKNDRKMQKYEGFKQYLCDKYERKCLTRKCPLAKHGCYSFMTFADLYRHTVSGRKSLMRTVNAVAKQEGYNLGVEK